MGLWHFLVVAVVFGSVTSVLKTIFSRRSSASGGEIAALRSRLAELESAQARRPALPPHQEERFAELESRIQTIETIVTGADEALERRLRQSAKDQAG